MRSTPTEKLILRTVKVSRQVSTVTANYVALEDLDALAVAFLNAVVNLYVVANVEVCDLRVDLLLLDWRG